MTYDEIAKYLERKDHTTVMSGIEKVESMLKTDPDIQAVINELKKRLSE